MCVVRENTSVTICSTHSYNLDLTSGPLGPHQIINNIVGAPPKHNMFGTFPGDSHFCMYKCLR